jgi:hypothetical protein
VKETGKIVRMRKRKFSVTSGEEVGEDEDEENQRKGRRRK